MKNALSACPCIIFHGERREREGPSHTRRERRDEERETRERGRKRG
jgi:hypothetical protein